MFDLVITGGLAVLPSGEQQADIAIAAGKIVAIGAPGGFAAVGAKRTVDAKGQYVIPGGIDPHVHCSWPIPMPGREPTMSGSPELVSRAALHGGTTTLLDFAVAPTGTKIQASIEKRQEDWVGKCFCDYGFHIMFNGKLSPEIYGEWGEAIQAGHASFKIFTTDITPSRLGRMVQYGDIWEILKVTAKQGGIGSIHAEDNDIVMHMYEKLTREDRVGFENMAEVHNTLSESLAFNRIIGLAESIPGAALYMLHTSAATGVRAMEQARQRGVPVYGETLHQYLLYSAEDYKKPNGQMYHTYPSLKYKEDHEALWAGTNRGAIQAVATDEVCCPLKVKIQGRRIDDTTGGNSGVEPRVAIIYSETVIKRGYSLGHFVDLISSNAAKIQGLYPRKGALAVGSDADVVLLDPRTKRTLKAPELHESDYTPWEGRTVDAWPSMTILRGKVMVENGTFTGDLKDGQFVPRKVSDDIRSRPAV